MADINIYGTLKNATPEGIIATADQIQDKTEGKKQSAINSDFKNRITELEEHGSGTVDQELDAESTNAVANKAVTEKLSELEAKNGFPTWLGQNKAIVVTTGELTTTENRNTTHLTDLSHIVGIQFIGEDARYYVVYYDSDDGFISADGWLTEKEYALSKAPEGAERFRVMIDTSVCSTDEVSISNEAESEEKGLIERVEVLESKVGDTRKELFIVDASGGGDYLTIEDALNSVGDSEKNPVVIIVMPGIYTPAPKIKNMPYKEGNRNISIIGVDKNKCILQGNVGYYYWQENIDYSLLRLSGNVTIKNLTFRNTSENYTSEAERNSWDLSSPHCRAYCIHLDSERKNGDVIDIDNCIMFNDHFSAIGFGLRTDSILRIKDCEIVSDVNVEKNILSLFSDYGTLYGHLASNSDTKNQRLEIIRCIIVNKNYKCAVNLMDAANEGAEGNVTMIQNVCKSSETGNSFIKDEKYVIEDISFGNNVISMNYE